MRCVFRTVLCMYLIDRWWETDLELTTSGEGRWRGGHGFLLLLRLTIILLLKRFD